MKKSLIVIVVAAVLCIFAGAAKMYEDPAIPANNTSDIVEIKEVNATPVDAIPEVKEEPISVEPEPIDPEPIEEVKEEEKAEETPEYTEYTVKAGDSFWSIAKKMYGNGKYYVNIAADNNMSADAIIHPGDTLRIYNELSAIAVSYTAAPVKDKSPIEEDKLPVSIGYGKSSFDGNLGVEEAKAILRDEPNLDTSGMEYLGTYRITGYDPHCKHCCGKTNGITASGYPAEFGVTAGCNSLPLGTKVYVEGYGVYRIDDRGGMSKKTIDIAAPSHDACYTLTNNSVNVWVIK